MTRVWEGKTVRLGVSPHAIEKAPRLFNATIIDVVNELLQNSRRAGATRVDVSAIEEDGTYYGELSDDGIGIFRDDVSIALGGGCWSGDIESAEYPAGMGIFSLASRGATLDSYGWRLALTPEHFSGMKDALVERSDRVNGTQIRFPLSKVEHRDFWYVIQACARYYPLPVFVGGKEVQRADFLAEALHVEEWRGLRIGVVPRDGFEINFYGLVVGEKLPNLVMGTERLFIRIDVVRAPELLLVLPARKEAVKNEFFAALKDECFRTIYRYILSKREHRLPSKTWRHAMSLGVSLPEASKRLSLFSPPTAEEADDWYATQCRSGLIDSGDDELVDVDSEAVIIEDTWYPAESQMLWRALSGKWSHRFLQSNSAFEGYSWYDAIPVLMLDRVEVEKDGKCYRLGHYPIAAEGRLVDKVLVYALLKDQSREPEPICLDTDMALIGDGVGYNDLSEVEVVVTKNSAPDVSDLADILVQAYFRPVENDVEADSVQTQRERFEEAALAKAAEILVSSEEALRQRIMLVIEREVCWMMPKGMKAEITVNGRSVSVDLGEEK